MANAVYDSRVHRRADAGHHPFRATHTELKFSGFTAVYEEGKDEEDGERTSSPLPDLRRGRAPGPARRPKAPSTSPSPPPATREATLIKALEEKGIGRPSTYAPTISTILDREYVVKEGKALRPTPLGEVVTQLMIDKFPDVVDPAFTAHMEDQLDEVEAGKIYWKDVLSRFLHRLLTPSWLRPRRIWTVSASRSRRNFPMRCAMLCGRQMVVKSGRFGRFLACPGYPECTFTKPLVIEMPGKCPKCGSRILKKTSRKRLHLLWLRAQQGGLRRAL